MIKEEAPSQYSALLLSTSSNGLRKENVVVVADALLEDVALEGITNSPTAACSDVDRADDVPRNPVRQDTMRCDRDRSRGATQAHPQVDTHSSAKWVFTYLICSVDAASSMLSSAICQKHAPCFMAGAETITPVRPK